jgi:hypothetical protein
MGSKSTKILNPLTEAELLQRFDSINKSLKANLFRQRKKISSKNPNLD